MSAETKAALVADIEKFSVEADGALDLLIIKHSDFSEIAADAVDGDEEAMRLVILLNGLLRKIKDAPRDNPMRCVSCPSPLREKQFAIGVALPGGSDPHNAMAVSVCSECATDIAGIHSRVVASFQTIWPDLRVIEITHSDGGHA